MASPGASVEALIEALEEPALLVGGTVILAANSAATALLGSGIRYRDIRFAMRHPRVLEHILGGHEADLEITGLRDQERPWLISVRRLDADTMFVRMFDRGDVVSAEKMRVDFVANASHELRTPLSTISGYAETIADGGLPEEVQARFSATIVEEARRLLQLIEDLMSLSRIEGERFALPSESIAIDTVVREAIANLSTLSRNSGCEIRFEHDDPLPPVRGDRTQLVQVVDNLLTNAMRYGCPGAHGLVTVSARENDGWLTLTVADQGPGIAREHLPRLTERFYRVDPARSRQSGGTGLGLAIVKHIVERHRGTLDIASEPGSGTSVTIRMPRASGSA